MGWISDIMKLVGVHQLCCHDDAIIPSMDAYVCNMDGTGMNGSDVTNIVVDTNTWFNNGEFMKIRFQYRVHMIRCSGFLKDYMVRNGDIVFVNPSSVDYDVLLNNYNAYIDGLIKISGQTWLGEYKNKFDNDILDQMRFETLKENCLDNYPNLKLNVNLFDGADLVSNIGNNDLDYYSFNDWRMANEMEIETFNNEYSLFDKERMYLIINENAKKKLILLGDIHNFVKPFEKNMNFIYQVNPDIIIGEWSWRLCGAKMPTKNQIYRALCSAMGNYSDKCGLTRKMRYQTNMNFHAPLKYANDHKKTVIFADFICDMLRFTEYSAFYSKLHAFMMKDMNTLSYTIAHQFITENACLNDYENWYFNPHNPTRKQALSQMRSLQMYKSIQATINTPNISNDASIIIGYFGLYHVMDIIGWIKGKENPPQNIL